jgi:hypothetical protein
LGTKAHFVGPCGVRLRHGLLGRMRFIAGTVVAAKGEPLFLYGFAAFCFEGIPLYAQLDAAPTLTRSSSHNADSDRELQRRVSIYLANRRLPSSSRLRIEAKNGVVTVRGTHDSFYHKQLCINCCQRVAGVVRLIDATRVRSRDLETA